MRTNQVRSWFYSAIIKAPTLHWQSREGERAWALDCLSIVFWRILTYIGFIGMIDFSKIPQCKSPFYSVQILPESTSVYRLTDTGHTSHIQSEGSRSHWIFGEIQFYRDLFSYVRTNQVRAWFYSAETDNIIPPTHTGRAAKYRYLFFFRNECVFQVPLMEVSIL